MVSSRATDTSVSTTRAWRSCSVQSVTATNVTRRDSQMRPQRFSADPFLHLSSASTAFPSPKVRLKPNCTLSSTRLSSPNRYGHQPYLHPVKQACTGPH